MQNHDANDRDAKRAAGDAAVAAQRAENDAAAAMKRAEGDAAADATRAANEQASDAHSDQSHHWRPQRINRGS